MRYIIMFGLTIIIALLILFYPRNYLMKFNNCVTIDYNNFIEGNWEYEISNDNILLKESADNKWIFVPNKNGKVNLTFINDEYKIEYEFDVKNNIIIWKQGQASGLLDYPNPY